VLPYLLYLPPPYLLLYACAHDTIFNTYYFDSDLLIHVSLSLYATWPSPHHSLGSSDSLRSACVDLGGQSLWILPVADQSGAARRGSSADRLRLYPSSPPAWLSNFPFVSHERLLYSSLLYISLYSHICAYR